VCGYVGLLMFVVDRDKINITDGAAEAKYVYDILNEAY
jgi:hypothetical protein